MASTTHGSPAIGILVADSNQTQRQLLVRALRQRPDLEISNCPLEGDAILGVLASNPIQVVIMNLAHPRDGWQDMTVVRRVHLVRPEVAQVLLLDSYDRDLVVNAFRSGARGLFCFAESPFRLLCKCIQSVYAGQIWANDQQLHYLIEAVTQVPSLRMVSARNEAIDSAGGTGRRTGCRWPEQPRSRGGTRPQRAHHQEVSVSHLRQARHFQPG